jgi:hypothetical protein
VTREDLIGQFALREGYDVQMNLFADGRFTQVVTIPGRSKLHYTGTWEFKESPGMGEDRVLLKPCAVVDDDNCHREARSTSVVDFCLWTVGKTVAGTPRIAGEDDCGTYWKVR